VTVTVTLPWPPRALWPNARGAWSEDEDERLKSLHGSASLSQIAEQFGRSKGSIRARITRLGIAKKTYWSDEETEVLRQTYETAGPDGVVGLERLAKTLGRDAANVCRKAKDMGLVINPNRRVVHERKVKPRMYATTEELRAAISARSKRRIAENGHPRGMLGKHHTEETRKHLSRTSKAAFLASTDEQRAEWTDKAMRTKIEKHGTLSPNVKRGSWAAGWREIGGQRKFYRSRWEANYARYLQWLKERGEIRDWQHEPETFWFHEIKRGSRTYLPDFRVWENNGISMLHEVKGWMDSRSKTKLKRMAKYYPEHKIILIDAPQYKAIRLKMMRLIAGWEDG
jgi:hypothetical protein